MALAPPRASAQAVLPGVKLDVSQADIRRAKPGTVLRVRPQVGGAPANAKAFRIIYRSTGINGEPIAVSGTVIYPDGPAPPEGRNVVAWAHYTTGVAQRCAPTLLPNLSGTIAGLEELLKRGYVVVATDYEGLGLPGVHAYLVGVSEAHSVLDSVRAARNLSNAHATNRFIVWGHSQGGHASLFSGELAAEYAPELKLVGIAAAAPATNLVELFKAQKGSIAGNSLTAMALLSWSRTYKLPLNSVLEDGADASFEKVAGSCIQSISQMLKLLQLAKPLKKSFLKADPTTLPAWHELHGKEFARQDPAWRAGVHRARNRRRHGQPQHHRSLRQAAVRFRHAGRHKAHEGRLAQFRRRKERLLRGRLDERSFQGAPGAERLQEELSAQCV